MLKNLANFKKEKKGKISDDELKQLRDKFKQVTQDSTAQKQESPGTGNKPAPETPSQADSGSAPQAQQQAAATEQNIKAQSGAETELVDPEQVMENDRITNLIMQQIKELIEINNNLNTKIKEVETRVSGNISSMVDVKNTVDRFNERLEFIEKNMEKFMGLYEVVTNMFNPFVSEDEHQTPEPRDQKPPAVEAEAIPAANASPEPKQDTSNPPGTVTNTTSSDSQSQPPKEPAAAAEPAQINTKEEAAVKPEGEKEVKADAKIPDAGTNATGNAAATDGEEKENIASSNVQGETGKKADNTAGTAEADKSTNTSTDEGAGTGNQPDKSDESYKSNSQKEAGDGKENAAEPNSAIAGTGLQEAANEGLKTADAANPKPAETASEGEENRQPAEESKESIIGNDNGEAAKEGEKEAGNDAGALKEAKTVLAGSLEGAAQSAKEGREALTGSRIYNSNINDADEVHPDFHFSLPDGTNITSINDLVDALKTMDNVIFSTHVNESTNDFAEWVKLVKGDQIAGRLENLRDKNLMLAELQKIL